VWFGIFANMSFAVTALYAPQRIQDGLGLRRLVSTVWLRNVGMLLVLVSMFNAGAARAPYRYPLYAWLVAIARLIASFFFFRVAFFNPQSSSERPRTFLTLGIFDLTMGLICGLLLYLGFPDEYRLSLKNFKRGTL